MVTPRIRNEFANLFLTEPSVRCIHDEVGALVAPTHQESEACLWRASRSIMKTLGLQNLQNLSLSPLAAGCLRVLLDRVVDRVLELEGYPEVVEPGLLEPRSPSDLF